MRKKIISLLLTLMMGRLVYAVDIDTDELDKEIQRLQEEKKLWIETVSKQKETKDAAAGIVSVITQEDIKRYGGRNLADVLNRVTSLYMTETSVYANSVASMRGDLATITNNHTLVLIDGRPVRDTMQGGLNQMVFQDFPIHQIEQIEVIRGSGSVLYGTNAVSGVINIITKKNKDNALTVRGRYGSFNTGQAEGEFAWKDAEASVTGAARYQDSRGWLLSANDEKNQPSAFHTSSQDVSTTVSANWKDFTLNVYFADMHSTHWNSAPIGAAAPMTYQRLFVDGGYKTQINSHWSTQLNVTYNHAAMYTYSLASSPFPLHSSEDNILLEQTQFLNFFDNRLNLTLGGLAEWQTGQMMQQDTSPPIPFYSYIKSSLYAEASYNLLDNLKLIGGGQWHRFDALNQNVTNNLPYKASTGLVGRLGLVYEINSNMGIKVLYNQSFRSPNAIELKINLPGIVTGNASLQSEQSESIESQFFYHTQNYSASLTAFRNRQSNLINRVPQPVSQNGLVYANGGSGIFQGLELETKATLFKKLHWTGAYTFQTNRDNQGRNNLSVVPNHIAKLGLSYDVTPQLQLSVFDTFFSAAKKIPAAMEVNPPANGYHNVTMNGNYRLDELFGSHFAKHVTLTLYVDNLLNEKIYYPEFNRKRINTIPASGGRSVFGEIALEF